MREHAGMQAREQIKKGMCNAFSENRDFTRSDRGKSQSEIPMYRDFSQPPTAKMYTHTNCKLVLVVVFSQDSSRTFLRSSRF